MQKVVSECCGRLTRYEGICWQIINTSFDCFIISWMNLELPRLFITITFSFSKSRIYINKAYLVILVIYAINSPSNPCLLLEGSLQGWSQNVYSSMDNAFAIQWCATTQVNHPWFAFYWKTSFLLLIIYLPLFLQEIWHDSDELLAFWPFAKGFITLLAVAMKETFICYSFCFYVSFLKYLLATI